VHEVKNRRRRRRAKGNKKKRKRLQIITLQNAIFTQT